MRSLVFLFSIAVAMTCLAVVGEPAPQSRKVFGLDQQPIDAAEHILQKLDAISDSAEEQTLRAAGLRTDGDALVAFFRERTQTKADLAALLTLARQLGDGKAEVRSQATAKLVGCGPWAIPALRQVVNDLDNPLAAQQARRCLEWVEGQRSTEVPIAAAKLLASRKPAAATETLLAFLPLADDQAVVEAVKAALNSLAARPGKTDAALLAALHDPSPLRRAVAGEVLIGSGQPEALPDARKLLGDPKPQVRLRAALALVARGDEQAVDVLIDLLAELPHADRTQAEKALHELAGEWSPNPPLPGDDELSRKVRREAWAGWWRTMDGPALLAALRQRTLTKEDEARVEALIAQMGDKTFANREKATTELLAMGPKVLGPLRAAAKGSDPERARRADVCIKLIAQHEEHEKLPTAAPRLLAVRKPKGAAEALLAYLPFTDNLAMKEEISKALTKLVMVGGQPDPVIVKALGDPLPVRRLAAAEALASVGGPAQRPELRKLLSDPDAEVRLRVALALVYAQDKQAVPVLINLMTELPRAQAWEAEQALQGLAGAKAPTVSWGKDDAAARKKVNEAWQTWWKANSVTVNMKELEKTRGGLGLTLVAELAPKAPKAGKKGGAAILNPAPAPGVAVNGDRIVALDRSGQQRWQIDNLQYPIDVQMLPGNRVLIAEYQGNRVTERNLKGDILWEVNLPNPPLNVQRLANGNTFVVLYVTGAAAILNGQPQMIEVDPTGKTVATFSATGIQQILGGKGKGGGGFGGVIDDLMVMAAHKLPDGQMVCLAADGSCIRLDATGKEVKRFIMPNAYVIIGNIDVTPKGHIIVSERNAVAEYDPDGKIVWQGKTAALSQRVTRLANGNTLVSSLAGGVTELDQTGRVLWQYQSTVGYQALRARRQ